MEFCNKGVVHADPPPPQLWSNTIFLQVFFGPSLRFSVAVAVRSLSWQPYGACLIPGSPRNFTRQVLFQHTHPSCQMLMVWRRRRRGEDGVRLSLYPQKLVVWRSRRRRRRTPGTVGKNEINKLVFLPTPPLLLVKSQIFKDNYFNPSPKQHLSIFFYVKCHQPETQIYCVSINIYLSKYVLKITAGKS